MVSQIGENLSVDLSDKTALVTGASSGLGAEIAKAFASSGAEVWLNYPNPTQELGVRSVLEAIEQAGGAAKLVLADVSEESSVTNMFEHLRSESNSLDILVNNAGIAHSSPIEKLQAIDFDRMLGVHLRGTFLCTRSALEIMYRQDSGRIINTASQLAYIGAPGFAHYTAAKGAILSFTRTLALEIGDRPITANCVAPGATMTPMLADVPDDILEGIRQKIPAGRLAEVGDIVGTYLFLASDAALHFRGQCLSPNGGDAFL